MTAALDGLLTRLGTLGVRLEAAGDRLRYDAPRAALTPELLADLRRHKGGLLAHLTGDGAERVVARAPVTAQQAGVVHAHHTAPYPQLWNVATRLTLTGRLDVAALETALTELVARHHGLRCRFVREDGKWFQEALAPRPRPLPVEDLTGLPPADRDRALAAIEEEAVGTPVDLGREVMPAPRLVRLGEESWTLILVLHHISCDGWAMTVMLRDLAALYGAAATGTPHALEPPGAQCTDYAVWQRERDDPSSTASRRAYWTVRLEGACFWPALPTDRPEPERLSGHGRTAGLEIPGDVRASVEALARARGTTAFAVTTGAFALLLSRLSGERDIVLLVPYANREREKFESMVACTAANIAARVRLDPSVSFGDLVARIGLDALEAIDHVTPLGPVLEGLRRSGVPGVPERLRIGMVYQNSFETGLALPGLDVAIADIPAPMARGELTFGLAPRPGAGEGFRVFAEHTTDLWDPETIDTWLREYATLLTEACAHPDTDVGSLLEAR